jgi:hypothetical protein
MGWEGITAMDMRVCFIEEYLKDCMPLTGGTPVPAAQRRFGHMGNGG